MRVGILNFLLPHERYNNKVQPTKQAGIFELSEIKSNLVKIVENEIFVPYFFSSLFTVSNTKYRKARPA